MQYQFFVRNRAGQFLSSLPLRWHWSRDQATAHDSWLEARLLAKRLPRIRNVEQYTEIVDQFGIIWTAQHATRAGLFGLRDAVPA